MSLGGSDRQRRKDGGSRARSRPRDLATEGLARRIEALVAAGLSAEAVREAVAGWYRRGEIDPAAIPVAERMLAAGGERPIRGAAGKFPVRPDTERADWEARAAQDVALLRRKVEEWHTDRVDEVILLSVFRRWRDLDREHGFDGTLMDRLVLRATMETVTKGIVADVRTNVLDEVKRRLTGERLRQLDECLSTAAALGRVATERPDELPSFARDVVWKTTKGLPGAISAAAGGAIESLPVPGTTAAGGWLQEQGRTYLEAVGYSTEDAGEVVSNERLVGEVTGTALQVAAGAGLAGAAGKAAQAGKAAVTAAKVLHIGGKAYDGAQFVAEVRQAYEQYRKPLLFAYKVLGDAAAARIKGEEVDFSLVLSRAAKEFLSSVGEEFQDARKTEEQLFRSAGEAIEEQKRLRGEMDAAEAEADRRGQAADAMPDRDRRSRRQMPGENVRQRKLAKRRADSGAQASKARAQAAAERYRQDEVVARRQQYDELRGAGASRLARYLVRNALRRLLVNVAHAVAAESVRESEAHGQTGTQPAPKGGLQALVLKVLQSTLREVLTDFATRSLGRNEKGALADHEKAFIDATSKALFALVERTLKDAKA